VDEEVIPRIRNAIARVANELAIPGEMNHLLVDEIFRGVEGDRDALASRFADALYEEGETVQPGTCIRRLVLIQKLLKFMKVVNYNIFIITYIRPACTHTGCIKTYIEQRNSDNIVFKVSVTTKDPQ
jgi:hypothetical protein